MKISKELSAVCNLCYSVTWLISEVCQTERWNSTLYLVSVAFLRAVGKGSSIHFAIFNPVEKREVWSSCHLADVLEISNCLVPKDAVWIFSYPIWGPGYCTDSAHNRPFHTIKVTLLLLLINSHRVVCSIQTILAFLCLMVWITDAFNLVFSPVYHTSLCSIQASSCGINFLSKF